MNYMNKTETDITGTQKKLRARRGTSEGAEKKSSNVKRRKRKMSRKPSRRKCANIKNQTRLGGRHNPMEQSSAGSDNDKRARNCRNARRCCGY
jgi:hypothetical protein